MILFYFLIVNIIFQKYTSFGVNRIGIDHYIRVYLDYGWTYFLCWSQCWRKLVLIKFLLMRSNSQSNSYWLPMWKVFTVEEKVLQPVIKMFLWHINHKLEICTWVETSHFGHFKLLFKKLGTYCHFFEIWSLLSLSTFWPKSKN